MNPGQAAAHPLVRRVGANAPATNRDGWEG